MITYKGTNFTIIDEFRKRAGTGSYQMFTFATGQSTAIPSSYKGSLAIPGEIEDEKGQKYVVTEIGPFSYFHCVDVTSLYVPASITIIREYGIAQLWYCTSLTFENNSKLTEIKDHGMYDFCRLKALVFTGNKLRILATRSITYAFEMETLIIPSSVKSIGLHSFLGYTQLKTLYYCGTFFIPENIFYAEGEYKRTNDSTQFFTSKRYRYDTFAGKEITSKNINVCTFPYSHKKYFFSTKNN